MTYGQTEPCHLLPRPRRQQRPHLHERGDERGVGVRARRHARGCHASQQRRHLQPAAPLAASTLPSRPEPATQQARACHQALSSTSAHAAPSCNTHGSLSPPPPQRKTAPHTCGAASTRPALQYACTMLLYTRRVSTSPSASAASARRRAAAGSPTRAYPATSTEYVTWEGGGGGVGGGRVIFCVEGGGGGTGPALSMPIGRWVRPTAHGAQLPASCQPRARYRLTRLGATPWACISSSSPSAAAGCRAAARPCMRLV